MRTNRSPAKRPLKKTRRLMRIETLETRVVLASMPLTPESWSTGHGVGSTYQLLADVNGDNRDDAVAVYTSGALAGNWYVALSSGSSFGGYSLWRAGHGAGASWVGAADVTGDGRADAVIAFTSGSLAGSWYVATSSGSGFNSPTAWQTGHGSGASAVGLGDVDADGRADAVAAFLSGPLAGNWYVARSQGNGFQSASLWRSGLGSGAHAARIGDVTGDGRADAVAVYTSGTLAGNWYVSASNGTSFYNYSRWYEGHGAGSERVLLSDVNGDGRKDALAYFSSSDYAGRWYVATSIGTTFVAASSFRSELAGTAMSGDVTGDGTDDPVTFSPTDGEWRTKRSDWLYATTAVSTGGSRNLDVLYPALTLVIPVDLNATSSGTITGAGSAVEFTGGGKLQQSGAINVLALNISAGITSSSANGLSLTGPGLSPTALFMTGSAVITAPGGVTVSSVLGLSSGNSISSGSAVSVTAGGTFQGAGTVSDLLTVGAGGVLSPASDSSQSSPVGTMQIGRLALLSQSELQIDTIAGSSTLTHDKIIVSGTVSLAGSRLRFTNSGSWPSGVQAKIIENKSPAAVEGLFVDAQGRVLQELCKLPATETGAGVDLWLTYRAGDGNDVALMSNGAPAAVSLTNVISSLTDIASTATRIRIADIVVTDDALGTNTISLSGTDAASFEVSGSALYLKAGVTLNAAARPWYSVTVRVADASAIGSTPVSASLTLQITGSGVTVPAGQTTTDATIHTGSYQLVKQGGGTLILDKANTHSGGTVVEAGTIIVKNASAFGTGEVRVKAGATLVIDQAAGEAVAGSLVIEEGGFVDLGTGRIRIVAGMTATALVDALLKGKGDGFWTTSAGIGSSAVSATVEMGTLRTIGWLDNGDGSFTAGFAAQGDTTMDGTVDILDASNFITSAKYDSGLYASWVDGDFNHDGVLDILDATDFFNSALFDQGIYLVSASAPAAMSATEPVAVAAAEQPSAIDSAFAALAFDTTATPPKRKNPFSSFR